MPGNIHARLAALPAFPTLTGARVRLREPRTDDIDGLFALFADPRAMRYWSSAPMRSRMQAEGKVEEMREAFERRESLDWVIADRRDDLAIGSCTLFRFDARHRRAEIGYALRAARWGQGMATEAVALALHWGFLTLDLHRVEADIDPRNEASRALLLRLGFRSEGVLRERFFVGDEATDSELFGLLAQVWRERSR